MPIAFKVEDGTGLSGATSYLTTAEATDILSVNPVASATWAGFTSPEQESLLIWSSRYIDQHIDWYGYKTVETSGLRWPRQCVTDRDGIHIPKDVIPEQLKRAAAQLALFLQASRAAQTGGQSAVLPEGIKHVKADVVEVEFFDDGSANSRSGTDLLPVNMAFLVRGLGTLITGRQRTARAVR